MENTSKSDYDLNNHKNKKTTQIQDSTFRVTEQIICYVFEKQMIQAIHIPSDSAFVVKREGRAGNRLIQIKYLLFNGMLLDFY